MGLYRRCSVVILVQITAIVSGCSPTAAAKNATPKNEIVWSGKLDAGVKFYQMTELGVLIAGTGKSLYAFDGESGEMLWRRKNARLAENDVAPVTGTDLVLLSFDKDDKTRFEAVDLLSGDTVWKSDKVRGSPMQMAVDIDSNLVAVVVAKDARARPGKQVKRRPVVHVMRLDDGNELWKRESEHEIEMIPLRWSGKEDEETSYGLDNYNPPMFLDRRLYLFYEGVTSFDASTGKERIREQFRVNEEGLALTEADPVSDQRFLYTSGRGRMRAVSRSSSRVEWEAKDLGLTPEVLIGNNRLFVRTGGRFTRLKDGETEQRGPYGVTALDANTGKTLWRFKGADKGITNLALLDDDSIALADGDDLILLDSATGKRRLKARHNVEKSAFIFINDRRQAVVGGQKDIAALDVFTGKEVWRQHCDFPSRGIFRIIAAVALRAASLYFRYGYLGFGGAPTLLRWSGLLRGGLPSLTSIAANAARERISSHFSVFGVASRLDPRSLSRLPRPSIDIEGRLLDRVDPASRAEKLSRFLLRRRRLSTVKGDWMYFYTDLKEGGRGLAGVNVHTGAIDRAIKLDEPDDRFTVDEATGLLFASNKDRLIALSVR